MFDTRQRQVASAAPRLASAFFPQMFMANTNMVKNCVGGRRTQARDFDCGSILAARKLAQYDGGKRVPATMSAIADAVRWAEEIMKEIDERWPVK